MKREWLVPGRVTELRVTPHTEPLRHATAPNVLWCADFKGQFRMGNGHYCYPLTVTDAHTRCLLACIALESTREDEAKAAFADVFRRHGLPQAMRTDNGVPFATRTLQGLSRLSAWWRRLGIAHERIEPGHPEQNGRHERMHRTLKVETTHPAGAHLLQQQDRFDRFEREYNEDRPHEALNDATPASRYTASQRPYPKELSDPIQSIHSTT